MKKCLPCLNEDCKPSSVTQEEDDFCPICYSEAISQAPCVQLKCGHIFHYECIKKKIESKWPGARITFGFLNCPSCKQLCENEILNPIIKPFLDIKKEIEKKAMDRMEVEHRDTVDDVAKPDGKYFRKPLEYAMNNFAYYICYDCKSPYFGGMRSCDENAGDGNANFDPKDLICGSCCSKKYNKEGQCAKHGSEYVEYKCKFCCKTSNWFCWGSTHFCDECHKNQVEDRNFVNTPKEKLPKCQGPGVCPSGGNHGQNGEEKLLGCSICRLQLL
jgi:E3 ubiquitin-protein ligase MYCBP2